MSTVFIRITDPAEQQVAWIIASPNEGENSSVSVGSLEDVSKLATGNRVVLLIPGADVLLTHTSIPTKNKQRLLKAIPYAFENQILDDVETQHFAIGTRDKNGNIPVVIIKKSKIEFWVDLLQQENIQANIICPDILTLPFEQNTWTVLHEKNLCLVRTGELSGFVTEVENLNGLIQASIGEELEQAPEKIRIINCENVDNIGDINDIDLVETEWTSEQYDNDPLTLMSETFNTTSTAISINLLQGAYAPRSQLSKNWRPWIPAAALLFVWLSLQGVVGITQYVNLGNESEALSREIKTVFNEVLPGKRFIKPRKRIEDELAKLQNSTQGTQEGFLDMLTQSSQALKNKDIKMLTGINYRNNQLDIELTIKDLQALDKLKQKLEETGMKAEIRSATADRDEVRSRLRITRPNS